MDAIRNTFRNITDSVMNVSNEERLVREATTMDKWGPTAQQMKAICDLTFQHASFHPVMKALMQRLSEPGKYWRHVYKALLVIDYALKNGSPEVAEYCRHHIIEIQTLQRYQHIDEDNRDQGLNVRERAKIVLELINDEKKLEEERKRAYACRDKYIGVSNDGSAASGYRGGASYPSRGGSSRYGSVSYEDSSVPSRSRDDADNRWGMGDSGDGDDSSLPEPEPLPESAAEEPKAQTNLFDTEFSEPAAAKPAQTGSLFDSLDMAPSQPAAPKTTGSFFDTPAASQQPAATTSFFDAPAAAPAPSNNTMSFFDMPASQPAQPAPAAKPKADPMSFFDMPASQPMQPTRTTAAPAASNNTMSFFDMPASQPATSNTSSAFSFTSTTPASTAQPAAGAKKDDMWGGLVNLDSLGSSSSSSTTPKSSGPMAGGQSMSGSKPMSAMSSTSTTGPAMRPMGSSMGSSMAFTSSSSTQPMQPTTAPNYDALRQPQYNPYAMQQQQYRMQQMQMQQRYNGSGF